jgi:Carboxypeptidase regulatory-like domain
LLFIALVSGMLVAQTFFGSIVGTITDSSGASVVNAKVGLTNTATGERRATTSGADGNYQFVNLIPGLYRVDVENAGFKHLTRDSIEVQVQATVRVDGVMQLGDVGQTVEVGAQIPLLQTETYSLGTVVDQRKVQEMPLNGRNVLNLVTLVPGVVAQGSALANPTGLNINSFGNYQINGAIAGQNATFLGGVTLNVKTNFVAILPTQDAISEFKVQTNGVGPEFGRIAGGVINLTSKSGTNQFHGNLSYARNLTAS